MDPFNSPGSSLESSYSGKVCKIGFTLSYKGIMMLTDNIIWNKESIVAIKLTNAALKATNLPAPNELLSIFTRV